MTTYEESEGGDLIRQKDEERRSLTAVWTDLQAAEAALQHAREVATSFKVALLNLQCELCDIKAGDVVYIRVWENSVPVQRLAKVMRPHFGGSSTFPSANPTSPLVRRLKKNGSVYTSTKTVYNWQTEREYHDEGLRNVKL